MDEGLVKYSGSGAQYVGVLRNSHEVAMTNKIGIYSDRCRQTQPTDNCSIKGNVGAEGRWYYLPTCKYYNQVIVDLSYGDRWFCSREEAEAAGYREAGGCK